MILVEGRRFVHKPFDSEEELENVVVDNAEYLFGSSSIYISKYLISTKDCDGTIPDGYAIDLETKVWYLVEAEISKHSVWSHITPQVAKQIIATNNPDSKQEPVDLAAERVRKDTELLDLFSDLGIHTIDIRQVLPGIIQNNTINAMPIDSVKDDRRDWAATLKNPVELWIVRKYAQFGREENVMDQIPDEFDPAPDTSTRKSEESQIALAQPRIKISNLIDAKLLTIGEKLSMAPISLETEFSENLRQLFVETDPFRHYTRCSRIQVVLPYIASKIRAARAKPKTDGLFGKLLAANF